MLDDVDDYGCYPPIISTTLLGNTYEVVLHHYNGADDNALFFDFGIRIAIEDVEKNMRGNVGTTCHLGVFVMRNL